MKVTELALLVNNCLDTRKTVKLYYELGLDPLSIPSDMDNDYLTVNKGRDGNIYAWYLDDRKTGAINLATGEIVTDDKKIDQLFC